MQYRRIYNEFNISSEKNELLKNRELQDSNIFQYLEILFQMDLNCFNQ